MKGKSFALFLRCDKSPFSGILSLHPKKKSQEGLNMAQTPNEMKMHNGQDESAIFVYLSSVIGRPRIILLKTVGGALSESGTADIAFTHDLFVS